MGLLKFVHIHKQTNKLTNSTEQSPTFREWRKSPSFYATPMYITVFTRSHQLVRIPSQINSFRALHLIYWRFVLILLFHLCLGLPSFLFPAGFLTLPCMHLSCPPYSPPPDTQIFHFLLKSCYNTVFSMECLCLDLQVSLERYSLNVLQNEKRFGENCEEK